MDDARFERLYSRHGARVLSWCRFALGSSQDAEDAAAESFTRLLNKGDRVPDEAVAAWLFTVSRRICADISRRRWREPPVDVFADDAAGSCDAHPAWPDPRLRAAVLKLTPLQRQVVYLRVIEDLPSAEVARLTRRSDAAVRMAHHRALNALASMLRGGDDGTADRAEAVAAID